MSNTDDSAVLIIVGYGRGLLRTLRRVIGDVQVMIIEEPAEAHARNAREHLLTDWPECDLYELDYRRPMAADLFHLWNPGLRVKAVIPTDDTAVVFAARLAERLGLPGSGPVPAGILADKWQLRQVADGAGIAGPEWRLARSPADVVALAEQLDAEVVLKPTARAGSSGVQILSAPAEAPGAWERSVARPPSSISRWSPSDSYLVERRMTGSQFNVNLLVSDGQVLFGNVTAQTVATGRHPVPLTHVTPPDVSPSLHAELVAQTERLVAAVGYQTGFIHCEWIVEDGVVRLIECAGRLAGQAVMLMIAYSYQIDIFSAYLSVMSGEPVTVALPTTPRWATAMMTKLVRPGRVSAIAGVEEARSRDGVVEVVVNVEEGGLVHELVSIPSAAARITAIGSDVAEARRIAEGALALLEITTEAVEPAAAMG